EEIVAAGHGVDEAHSGGSGFAAHVELRHGAKAEPSRQVLNGEGQDQASGQMTISEALRSRRETHEGHHAEGGPAAVVSPEVQLRADFRGTQAGVPRRDARAVGTNRLVRAEHQLEIEVLPEPDLEIGGQHRAPHRMGSMGVVPGVLDEAELNLEVPRRHGVGAFRHVWPIGVQRPLLSRLSLSDTRGGALQQTQDEREKDDPPSPGRWWRKLLWRSSSSILS